jgi:DNA ligase (NAD+)
MTTLSIPVCPAADSSIAGIAELQQQIAYHDRRYFLESSPEISDHEYDMLRKELAHLQEQWPESEAVADESFPLIGDDRQPGFPKQSHRQPMLSLDKCHSPEDVKVWLGKVEKEVGDANSQIVIEPKLDGLAISLVYHEGRFVRAVTRGNGSEGDDLTANVLAMGGFPLVLGEREDGSQKDPLPEYVELRGEIFLPLDRFAEINRTRELEGEDLFKTPRNLAAGTVRLDDRTLVAERGLQLACYAWGEWLPGPDEPGSQTAFLKRLKAWGVPALEPVGSMRAGDTKSLASSLRELENRVARLNVPTDGLVMKVDSTKLRRLMGEGPASPKWATAYKFPPATTAARVNAIRFQIGRTGTLTPVAELEPVELKGRTVSRVSLHNPAFIDRMDIRVGDFLEIRLSGDTIPAAVGLQLDQRPPGVDPFQIPELCPSCGTMLSEDEGGARLWCPDFNCPAKRLQQLVHFAKLVNIRGMGPATVEALSAAGLLRDVADFYVLKHSSEQLSGILGEAACAHLLPAIEESRRAPRWKVLAGLGIDGLGPVACRKVGKAVNSIDELLLGEWDSAQLVGAGLTPLQAEAVEAFRAYSIESGLARRLAGIFIGAGTD